MPAPFEVFGNVAIINHSTQEYSLPATSFIKRMDKVISRQRLKHSKILCLRHGMHQVIGCFNIGREILNAFFFQQVAGDEGNTVAEIAVFMKASFVSYQANNIMALLQQNGNQPCTYIAISTSN